MWPMLLDMSRDECKRILRKLELEAYASIVTAFRAQGSLTKEKKKLLQDLSSMLSISLERHRAEIRRAVNDEHLNTIADRISGPNTSADWSIEGRRLIPLMPRLVPQTAFTAMANAVASIQAAKNASMPIPSASSVKEGSIPTTSSAPPTPSRTPTPTQTCKVSTSTSGIKTSPVTGNSPVAITSGVAMKVTQSEQEENIDDESNGRKRKRSASLDSAPLPEKIMATSQPVSSSDAQTTEKVVKNVNSVPFPASTSLLSQITPAVRATYGGTPIRIALPPTQKQATTVSSSTPKQVVLVPASNTSTSSNIFQRSVNIPIVKTVSTTASTITQKQSKLLSCSQSPSAQGALLMTGKLATAPSVITATVGQTSTVGTIARPLTKTLPIPRQIMRPRSSVLPYQNKVQLVGQNFSTQLPTPTVRQSLHLGTPIQVKQMSAVGRTAVQIRHEGGVKIVAQGLPVATSKILPKPTAPPIVMVSSTQSGGALARFTAPSVVPQNTFGTKVVSLSGSQAQVTSKVTTIGNVSLVSRTAHGFTARGSPTIIQPPGVKPNVIVVHKAQVWPQSQGQGTTIVVSGGSVPKLSAEAVQEAVTYIQKQERNRINTPATIISVPLANAVITSTPLTTATKPTLATTTYPSITSEKHALSSESTSIISDSKNQANQDKVKEERNRKSNLLADLIEATGILSDTSEPSLLTGSVKSSVDGVKKTASTEETVSTKVEPVKETEEQEVINETWTSESGSQEVVPLETTDEKESTEEPQLLNMDPSSVNIQDLNLPLEQLDEGQILEIQTQDEEGLLSQSTRLTKEMLEELLQQAGLHIQGVEVKNELQNEGNQTPIAATPSELNISKPTLSSLSVDEVTSQSKNDDPKLAKESTVDSCMKFVLCEQNSPFESANIEKTIEEIALKGDEVFENAELQQKCIEEEESQCDEQATVIELLNSEFNVSQLEDDQFVEEELDIPELTKSNPKKEDKDICLAQTATLSFPSKRYLSEENVKVDYMTVMPEDLKGIFQKAPLETVQLEEKDINSPEAAYGNVRVEPSGLDTTSMNLEDFTSQRVEGNVTDDCSFDINQELESTTDADNTEENLCPIGDNTCELSIENSCKQDEKNTEETKANKCQTSEETSFKLFEENALTVAEENTRKLAKNSICKSDEENICKPVEISCKPAEESNSNLAKQIVYETVKEGSFELNVENICKPSHESTCQMIEQTNTETSVKSAEVKIVLSTDENVCRLSEGTSCIPIKESSKPLEDSTCNPVEELVLATAEESTKQSECPSESSEEPAVDGSNVDVPVRRKRKYPVELQELPHLTGWARMASGLLEKVCKFRGPGRVVGAAHWFLQPVISAEAPGYYDVVKQPMDFSTMKKKLENGRYQNLTEFHADMMLVRSNCELYNPPGHEARTDCEEVFSFYLQEYNRIVEKWQKSHLLSSSRRSKAAKE